MRCQRAAERLGALVLLAALLATGGPAAALPPPLLLGLQARLEEHDRLAAEVHRLLVAGKLPEAVAAAEKVVASDREVFGSAHEQVAVSLEVWADLLARQMDFAAARKARQEVLAIQLRLFGERDWRVTDARNALAEGDRFARMSPDERRRLAEAVRLDYRSTAFTNGAKLPEALEAARQSLELRRELFGNDHPQLAQGLNTLGRVLHVQGDYVAARSCYEQALAIREKALGPDHPETALTLSNLGNLLQLLGDYVGARPCLERVLAIEREAWGPEHPQTAGTLYSLGALLHAQGDYAGARPYLEQALAIWKKVWGPENYQTARSLQGLGSLLYAQGDYTGARPYFEQALAIREKVLGPEHRDTATSLNNLGNLVLAQRDYAEARRYLERAQAVRKKVLGPEHPDTAISLRSLGSLQSAQGDYAGARPYLEQALAIWKKTWGPEHPYTAAGRSALGQLLDAQGDYAGARAYFEQAVAVMENNLALAAAGQSERQQLAMSRSLRQQLDGYLSLAARAHLPGEEVYGPLLRWKGAILARQQQAVGHTDPEVRDLLRRRQSASSRLAKLAFAVPGPERQAAWRRQLSDLSREKEDLDRQLAGRSAAFRELQARQALTPQQLQQALPPGTALVDLAEYTYSVPPPAGKGEWKRQRHLAAFVLRSDQPIVQVDLGPAAPIDQAVEAWRERFRGAAGQAEGNPVAELRRRVWEPLAAHLQGATTVLVSPDGALARFPFAALPGKEPGTYLLEERAIAVVPVPQLLPALTAANGPAAAKEPSLLVVGDVDYGAAAAPPGLVADVRSAPRGDRAGALRGWAPLPGTRAEVAALTGSFRRRFAGGTVTELRGAEATEEAFRRNASVHRYVHVATHGFFAPPELMSALARSKAEQALPGDLFGQQDVGGWHPGLLSGLVLAGANRPGEPGRDDGILTALEVAAQDLSGVELAVLSACETGLGATAGGEGLLGLQRAFQAAGARTLVASLWGVNDAATSVLMEEFYTNLWQRKMPKLEALRQAQLTVLRHPERVEERAKESSNELAQRGGGKEPGDLPSRGQVGPGQARRSPPAWWAAFILSGDTR